MTELSTRTPQNLANAFTATVALFLAHLLFLSVGLFPLHWMDLLAETTPVLYLLLTLVYIFVSGWLAYQLGYHPILIALLCVGLILPLVDFAVFLLLFLHGQNAVRKQNYEIVLLGARPR